MRVTTISIVVFIISALGFPTADTMADEIYRWVDENGVVHFGDRPDSPDNAETVRIESSSEAPAAEPDSPYSGQQQEPTLSYAQQQRDERAKERNERADKMKSLAIECEQANKTVASLEPVIRVMVEQPDGSVVRMNDDDRLEHLRVAKEFIADNCNK